MSDHLNALGQFQLLLQTKTRASLGSAARADREPVDSLNGKFESIFAQTKVPPSAQPLIRSLVLLWHDHLEASHSISQNIQSIDGSFLHGIMHRREPDYGNAKYWFHRVREHPCFPIIAEKAKKLLTDANATQLNAKLIHDGDWDAFAFIDACEKALLKEDATNIALLEKIQEIEFKTLLEHYLRPAGFFTAR